MVEVQGASLEQKQTMLECPHACLAFLEQQGIRADFLRKMPLPATGEQLHTFLQGRMREFNFPEEFPILAVMARDLFLRDAALATLRFFALDDTYVHQMAALEALATVPGEEYVKEILNRKKHATQPISTSVRQQVGTTMESPYIS